MPLRSLVLVFTFFAWLYPGQVLAQQQQPPADGRTLELVDRLKEILQRQERNRNADPKLLEQLRDLVRRYDWPWRARLLSEDFSQSNYRLEPTWVVAQGDFRLTRQGLRTVFLPPSRSVQRKEESPTLDILGGILKGMTGSGGSSEPPPAPSSAEIYADLRISNAFAFNLQMLSRATSDADRRLEFGPYQGRERGSGYRLAYNPGRRPAFELLRISRGRSSVIEVSESAVDLEDGASHGLEWRRSPDGEMTVFLDGREIIRALDRASGDDFDGFAVVNGGGDYTFVRIEIFGAAR
jgi:hypothetical protein